MIPLKIVIKGAVSSPPAQVQEPEDQRKNSPAGASSENGAGIGQAVEGQIKKLLFSKMRNRQHNLSFEP